MDIETFCDNYCPMPCRIVQRDGTTEVDCDTNDGYDPSDPQYNPCPFKDMDFSKVKVSEFGEHITIPEALEEQWKKRWNPAPPDLLLTEVAKKMYQLVRHDFPEYELWGFDTWEDMPVNTQEGWKENATKFLAHSQPLIEQAERKKIGEWLSKLPYILKDGGNLSDRYYFIEEDDIARLKSGEPLEGGKG